MLEIRFHGRGGQGTVLAAKIIADAVLRDGLRQCLAIPEFGVERRGAPVVAYARVDDKPILIRTRIYRPDALVVLDPTLYAARILDGLAPGSLVVTNGTEADRAALQEREPRLRFVAVPARFIALDLGLGAASSPIVNTAMCGAAAAALGLCPMRPLLDCVREAVPVKADQNVEAARRGYEAALEASRAHP